MSGISATSGRVFTRSNRRAQYGVCECCDSTARCPIFADPTPVTMNVTLAGLTSHVAADYGDKGSTFQLESAYWHGLDLNGTYTVAQEGNCYWHCIIPGRLAEVEGGAPDFAIDPARAFGLDISVSIAGEPPVMKVRASVVENPPGFSIGSGALGTFFGSQTVVVSADIPAPEPVLITPTAIWGPVPNASPAPTDTSTVLNGAGSGNAKFDETYIAATHLAGGGTVTVQGSATIATSCGALPEPICKGGCAENLCVEIWFKSGTTISRYRWVAVRTGGNTWTASHPVGEPANQLGITITCNGNAADPRWLITFVDNNTSPTFGTVIFSGDGAVCPNEVGIWELVSTTGSFDQIVVRRITVSTDPITDCPAPPPPATDCHQCPVNGDTGTGNYTFTPGDGDPLEQSCAAMYAYGLAASIPLVWDSGRGVNGQWYGTVGTVPNPGAIEFAVEPAVPPSIGNICNYNVILRVWQDGGGSSDIRGFNQVGDAKSLKGSFEISFGPCTVAIKSKVNYNVTMNPSKCWDGGACIAGAPNEQGVCP